LIQPAVGDNKAALIERFVDFSSKYGLGYKLTNGSYGVLFNDSTKLITHPNLFHFDYIERSKTKNKETATSELVSHHNFFEYPATINKKVVLLQHFKSYLDGNSKFKPISFDFGSQKPPERPEGEALSYIKKWKKASKAILMRSSNKVIQVVFQDSSELILCSGNSQVTFVNAKASSVKRVPLSSSPGNNLNLEIEEPSLFKRLQYAKEILM
jgi:polo-like kinase 1